MKQYHLQQVKFPIISQTSINSSQPKTIPTTTHKEKSPAQSQMIRIIIALLIAIFIYNSSQQTTINYNQIIKNQKMFLVKNIRGVIPTLSGEVYKLKNEWVIVHYENYHQNDSQIFNQYMIQFNVSNMMIKNIQCGLLIQYNWVNYSYNIDLQQISYSDNNSIVSSSNIDQIINNQNNINNQQLNNKQQNNLINNQNIQNIQNTNTNNNINNSNNNDQINNNQQQERQISSNLQQQQIIIKNNSLINSNNNNKSTNNQQQNLLQSQNNHIQISSTTQIQNNYQSLLSINNNSSSSFNSNISNNQSLSQSIKVGITNYNNNNNSLQKIIKKQKCNYTNKYLRQIMKFTSIWTISNHHLYLLMENTHLQQDYYLILKPYHNY